MNGFAAAGTTQHLLHRNGSYCNQLRASCGKFWSISLKQLWHFLGVLLLLQLFFLDWGGRFLGSLAVFVCLEVMRGTHQWSHFRQPRRSKQVDSLRFEFSIKRATRT